MYKFTFLPTKKLTLVIPTSDETHFSLNKYILRLFVRIIKVNHVLYFSVILNQFNKKRMKLNIKAYLLLLFYYQYMLIS